MTLEIYVCAAYRNLHDDVNVLSFFLGGKKQKNKKHCFFFFQKKMCISFTKNYQEWDLDTR